jgi:Na+/phosphate symporter
VEESAHCALLALVQGDERAAQSVLAKRGAVLDMAAELNRLQSVRLALDDPDRLLKHRVQFEILDRLRRVYNLAEHMAITVLPRGALAGELAV